MRSARVALCAVLVLGLVGLSAAGRLAFAAPPPVPSLNGDNLTDLIIGVPNEAYVSGMTNAPQAGAVNVMYSAVSGLASIGSQTWNQGGTVVAGQPDENDHYGFAVASGDFNGDDYADMALGTPYEDPGAATDAGSVAIFHGSPSGVTSAGNYDFNQNKTGIEGKPMLPNENFGYSLATGDFNADGYDDLAIGVPGDVIGLAGAAGGVNVNYGSATGLFDVNGMVGPDQNWYQGKDGLQGAPAAGNGFGKSLATGDFNGDGVDDLAVGAPGDTAGGIANAGGVYILLGSSGAGLTAGGSQAWNLEVTDVAGTAAAGTAYGASLAAGDLNGDGKYDLAVGIPKYASGGANESGAVSVLYSAASGLAAAGSQIWDQGVTGVEGDTEAGEQFGYSLATADFNWDGYADLAIGVPYDRVGGVSAGAVNVIHGSAAGLNAVTKDDQIWNQGDASPTGLEDTAEEGDSFGYSLAAGDFNNDGYADLAVGVPFEEVDNAPQDAGAVNVIYGALGGLAAANDQLWDQGDNSTGVHGAAAAGENFGASLAASGIEVKDVPVTPPPTTPPPGGELHVFLPLMHNTTP